MSGFGLDVIGRFYWAMVSFGICVCVLTAKDILGGVIWQICVKGGKDIA